MDSDRYYIRKEALEMARGDWDCDRRSSEKEIIKRARAYEAYLDQSDTKASIPPIPPKP
jgi:hypothetical protein